MGHVHRPREEGAVEVGDGPGRPSREPDLLGRIPAVARQVADGCPLQTCHHRMTPGTANSAIASRWRPTRRATRPTPRRAVGAGRALGRHGRLVQHRRHCSRSVPPGHSGTDGSPAGGAPATRSAAVAHVGPGSLTSAWCPGRSRRSGRWARSGCPARPRVVWSSGPACSGSRRHGRWPGGAWPWSCSKPGRTGPRAVWLQGRRPDLPAGIPRTPLRGDGPPGPGAVGRARSPERPSAAPRDRPGGLRRRSRIHLRRHGGGRRTLRTAEHPGPRREVPRNRHRRSRAVRSRFRRARRGFVPARRSATTPISR